MPSSSFRSKFENTPVRYFLKEMNHQAHLLGMSSSYYDSPHGLMNKSNYSTAEDQAILVSEVMKIEFYRKVVNTIVHETVALSGTDKKNLTNYRWENTNKLLGKLDGLIGTKTGITQAAGPCFAGYYENPELGLKLAMILCHSKSMEDRWQEIRLMVDWVKAEREKTTAKAIKE